MYLIKVRFDSNIKGIYTEETQTADDKSSAQFKYERALDRWFEILTGMQVYHISNITHHQYSKNIFLQEPTKYNDIVYDLKNKLKLLIIQELINLGNTNLLEGEQERKFEITMEEV